MLSSLALGTIPAPATLPFHAHHPCRYIRYNRTTHRNARPVRVTVPRKALVTCPPRIRLEFQCIHAQAGLSRFGTGRREIELSEDDGNAALRLDGGRRTGVDEQPPGSSGRRFQIEMVETRLQRVLGPGDGRLSCATRKLCRSVWIRLLGSYMRFTVRLSTRILDAVVLCSDMQSASVLRTELRWLLGSGLWLRGSVSSGIQSVCLHAEPDDWSLWPLQWQLCRRLCSS